MQIIWRKWRTVFTLSIRTDTPEQTVQNAASDQGLHYLSHTQQLYRLTKTLAQSLV